MNAPLLDASVLIALVIDDHVHHDRVSRWVEHSGGFALCAIVEGALVRFLVRLGESVSTAQGVLMALHADPRCQFWSESPSYTDVDLRSVHGHRQVTDAYLAGLASARSSVLATLDAGLAAFRPASTVLIP